MAGLAPRKKKSPVLKPGFSVGNADDITAKLVEPLVRLLLAFLRPQQQVFPQLELQLVYQSMVAHQLLQLELQWLLLPFSRMRPRRSVR